MPPPLGGQVPVVPANLTGPGVFNLYKDYGAIPGDTTGLSLYNAFETARIAAKAYQAANSGSAVVFYLPAGKYFIKYPFLNDVGFSFIRGDGVEATLIETLNGGCYSPIIVGIDRAPNNHTLSSDHWVDLNTIMPGTFPTAGTAWGYRTKTDSHLTFPASAFSSSGCSVSGSTAYWRGCPQFTIDFCVDWFGQDMPNMDLCGMGDVEGPCPWQIVTNPGIYYFRFVTPDRAYRIIGFSVPGSVGKNIHRVSIQVDLINCKFQAWIGATHAAKTRVAMNPATGTGGSGPSFTPADNIRLRPNYTMPFGIGALSSHSGSSGSAGHVDRGWYGFQLARGFLYNEGTVGGSQTRVDSTNVGDGNCYFSNNSAVICRMGVDTGPSGPGSGRLISWYSKGDNETDGANYNGRGYGLFMSSDVQGSGNFNVWSQGVTDLSLKVVGPFGQCLGIGGNFGLVIRDVGTEGGWNGLGSIPMGPSWPTEIIGTKHNYHYDSSICLDTHITRKIESIDCGHVGTCAIRLYGGSGGYYVLKEIYANYQQSRGECTVHWHGGTGPRQFLLEGLVLDNEGYPFPNRAAVILENGWAGFTRANISRISPGHMGAPHTVILELVDRYHPGISGFEPATITIKDLTGQEFAALVKTTGTLWRGILSDCVDPSRPSAIQNTAMVINEGPGGLGEIRVNHSYPGIPRVGTWYKGMATIDQINPAYGRYTRLICRKTGTYGTPTPPLWTGCDMITVSDYDSSAYVDSEDSVVANWTLT